jgi:DNA-binding transcriptional ArsR family regulator
MTGHKRFTAKVLATLLRELLTKSMTYDDMCAATGLMQITVSAWIKSLRTEGLIHVCGWDKDSRGYATIARFKWAPDKTDVPRPSMTAAESARLRRRAKKALAGAAA